MTSIPLYIRLRLARLFEKWANKNDVKISTLNCITFLAENDLIDIDCAESLIISSQSRKRENTMVTVETVNLEDFYESLKESKGYFTISDLGKQIAEKVARVIFEGIEDIFEEDEFYNEIYYDGYEGAILTRDHIREKFDALKKKYTEGE